MDASKPGGRPTAGAEAGSGEHAREGGERDE